MSDCLMDLKLATLAFDCLTLLLSMMVGLPIFSVSVCWLFVFVTVVAALAAVVVTFSSSVSSSVVVMEASVLVVVASSNRNENM